MTFQQDNRCGYVGEAILPSLSSLLSFVFSQCSPEPGAPGSQTAGEHTPWVSFHRSADWLWADPAGSQEQSLAER